MSQDNRTPTYTSYRKRAHAQRVFLMVMAIVNAFASIMLIAHIIIQWKGLL